MNVASAYAGALNAGRVIAVNNPVSVVITHEDDDYFWGVMRRLFLKEIGSLLNNGNYLQAFISALSFARMEAGLFYAVLSTLSKDNEKHLMVTISFEDDVEDAKKDNLIKHIAAETWWISGGYFPAVQFRTEVTVRSRKKRGHRSTKSIWPVQYTPQKQYYEDGQVPAQYNDQGDWVDAHWGQVWVPGPEKDAWNYTEYILGEMEAQQYGYHEFGNLPESVDRV